jgi:hypothetical protein
MRYALLNPILEELARDDKIRIEGENIRPIFFRDCFQHVKLDTPMIASSHPSHEDEIKKKGWWQFWK